MNWEALSTISEIVSATAVVISLLYLSKQIHNNTKEVEEQSKAQRFNVLGYLGDQWRGFRSNIASNPEVASIWRRGNEDPNQLNEDEYTVFNILMVEFFWSFSYNWVMGVEEGVGEYLRESLAENIVIYDSPGIRKWWAESPHRQEYPQEFIKIIDNLFKTTN